MNYLKNASSALTIYDLEGRRVADVPIPAMGSIWGRIGGDWSSKEAFFTFYSYAIPHTIYQVSLDGKIVEWNKVKSDIDPHQYEVKQLWFNSKDGTRVPMFVVHKKGLQLNGRNPVLLSGYGGFNLGRTPVFNRNAMLLLLEHGGSMPMCNSGVAASLAKNGTVPACWIKSKTSSTTLLQRLNT